MNKRELAFEMKYTEPGTPIRFITSVNINGKEVTLSLDPDRMTYTGRFCIDGKDTDEYFIPSGGVIQS